jgi:hypothetical protein
MSVVHGADYSAGELLPHEIDQHKDHDIRFLGRYIGFPDNPKCISHFPGAYQKHVRAGRMVLLFFENQTDDRAGGRDRGVANAHLALQDARTIGYPDHLPIFFSADAHLDAVGIPVANAMAYLDGAASVMGINRTGAYGFREFIGPAREGGHARWFWLAGTEPTDREIRHGLTHFYQSNKGQIKIGGIEADLDLAYRGVLDLLRLPVPTKLPVEPGGKFNSAVEAHLLHIWHVTHTDPEAAKAVAAEVAAWKLYFRELDLWSSKNEIDDHHQHELTFAHRRLGVI